MSLKAPTPGTMLGLAARENRRDQRASRPRSSVRRRFSTGVRLMLAVAALALGLSGFSMSSAQAWPWDDMRDNIAATITNICGPIDVPDPNHHASTLDTLAGMNETARAGYRETLLPEFSEDENGTAGGNGMERLQNVYEPHGAVIAEPTYERYGFVGLSWNQYGMDCFSPGLLLGPVADMVLILGVNVPMMIGMAFLNVVMDNVLYDAFAAMMHPFIGAMFRIFDPWIFFLVPIGILATWITTRASVQATSSAAFWGLLVLSVYLLMGASTTRFVSWATNIVTEVSGTVSCQINAAGTGDGTGQEHSLATQPGEESSPLDGQSECDDDDPIRAINQALWSGIPYQTWHVGQVGEAQANMDEDAEEEGLVGWGPALLNAQYVGTESGEGELELDDDAVEVLEATERWNRANYTPDADNGKISLWADGIWEEVPYLGTIKMMCNDVGEPGHDEADDPGEKTRFMYSGNDQDATFCDGAGAGTQTMLPYIQGEGYNQQFLLAASGFIGSVAIAGTILAAATYLGFQKMMFFFLLFLAPLVLLVSSIGDRKRRPFAIRYAEILAVNLLKQIAAVAIVLFVSHAMSSLFASATFSAVPWIMKPYVAILFFLALAFLAFPLKNLVKGAAKGDTSVLDRQATAPQRMAKKGGALALKGAGIGAAVATAGIAAPAAGAALGKGAMVGKAGTALGQAGRAMGTGTKAGRALRSTGMLMRSGQNVMDSRDTKRGQQTALKKEAGMLLKANEGNRYRDEKGQMRPGAEKLAQKDAQKMAEGGQKADRATRAQDAHMKSWFNQYRAEHNGQHHPEDPSSPENRRKARMQNHRNDARGEGDQTPKPEPIPGPFPPPGGGNNAGGGYNGPGNNGNNSGNNNSGNNNSGGNNTPGNSESEGSRNGPRDFVNRSQHEQMRNPIIPDYAPARERYQSAARENLNGPTFAKDMEYKVSTVSSGDDVLSNAGLTREQAIADPTKLLSGEAYEGGSTTKMDPFHPAAQAMNNLRFASASKDPDAMERAVAQASGAIEQHGVPDQVSGVHSIGDKAGQFQSLGLVGAMPNLNENSTWEERSDAAHTMRAAQVAMPQDYAARGAVENYVDALSNPGVPFQQVESMKASTIEQISQADGLDSSGGDSSPTPPVSGAFAGAAPAATGASAASFGGGDGYAPTNYEAPMATPSAGAAYGHEATPSNQQTYSGNTSEQAPQEPPVADYGPRPSQGTSEGAAPSEANLPEYRPSAYADPTPTAYGGPPSAYPEAAPEQAPPAAGPPPAAYEPLPYADPAPAPSYNEQGSQGPDRYAEGYADAQAAHGPSGSGGASADELRNAVAEGMRDHAQTQGSGPSGGQYAAADFQAAPLDSGPTAAAPMDSTPSQSAPTWRDQGGMSGPDAPAQGPNAGDSEYANQGDTEEGMVFRPPKKRKRSSFFDQDESPGGDD